MSDEGLIIFLIILAVVIDALLAIIPANIATNKDSGYYGFWWLCGFLMFPVALVVALAIPYKNTLLTPAVINAANELKEIKALLSKLSNKATVVTNNVIAQKSEEGKVEEVPEEAKDPVAAIKTSAEEDSNEEVYVDPEKRSLEKKQADLRSEIAKQDQIILRARKEKRAEVPSYIERQKLWKQINDLERRKDKLGAFAGSEKKQIDDEISAIRAKRAALNEKAEEEQKVRDANADEKIEPARNARAELQRQLNEVLKRIYKIDNTLARGQEE